MRGEDLSSLFLLARAAAAIALAAGAIVGVLIFIGG